jgi:hypothetical protein
METTICIIRGAVNSLSNSPPSLPLMRYTVTKDRDGKNTVDAEMLDESSSYEDIAMY